MGILILGLPGAGKGVQSERLASRLRIPHLSIGGFVRDQIAHKTRLGREILEFFSGSNSWRSLSDVLAIKVAEQMTKGHADYVLDGFPRTLVQAESANFLEPVTAVVFLDVDESIARKRVLDRQRPGDSAELFEVRLAEERERLPKLVEFIRSRWWLLNIDADQSPEKIEALIATKLGLREETA